MNFWYISILDTNQFTSTQTINITVKPSKTLLGFEWMVPEASQKQSDYYGCRNTYLFVQTRWQFVSGKLFTRICFSWYHTVTFTCEGGQNNNKYPGG
jgi:hypothetical protein